MTESRDKQRTDWSEDRTIMANERTFSSWMGTGMGSIGVAIALKAVFGAVEPTWLAKSVATIFLIIAIVLFTAARRNACATFARLTESDVEAKSTKDFTLISWGLSLGTGAVGVVLWLI